MATFSSNSNRNRVIALSVLTLCCVGFTGGFIYLQQRPEVVPVDNILNAPDPKLVAETEQRKKETILKFREKWQVWAKAHQPQLRAMLNAQSNDTAALQAVVSAIPDMPSQAKTGFDTKPFSGIKNFSDPVVEDLNYTHFHFHVVRTTAEGIELDAKKARFEKLRDSAGFAQFRDVVVLFNSSAWSKKFYYLWASGRVTESAHITPNLNTSYVSIAPLYDFLTSQTKK